ncbi:MAG: hypothetical protein A2X12_11430 [Bacteroidetes bacterium GWE2_29_8]|nr:MAG: hypothetical protein A2X12_11430 [Bacteroidetes bacterium GWE2_29_8]
MAVIGKIRKRSGLLVAIIGLALAAFVLSDFFKKGRSNGPEDLAKIGDTPISYYEFENKIKDQEESFKKQTGEENIDQETQYQIKQQTWMQLLKEVLFAKEYDELGIVISEEELADLAYGKEPHAYVVRTFSDPKTGTFNPANVIEFLKTFDQREPEVKKQWLQIEKYIKEDRLSMKYNNLIKEGFYVTKSLTKHYNEENNKIVDATYILQRYNTINDKTIKLDDADYKKYYDSNKNEYFREAGRNFEFVVFDVNPSAKDVEEVEASINNLKTEFINSQDDADLVTNVSDFRYDSLFHKKGDFSPLMDSMVFKLNIGEVVGPYNENGVYKLFKVLERQIRPDSINARHILVAHKGAYGVDPKLVKRDTVEAKKMADSLRLVVLKDTTQFGNIAQSMSDDPSAKENRGNLGWFQDQRMIKNFNEACVKSNVGDIVVVETVFGYHVIQIMGKKEPEEKAKVAIIAKILEPSKETYNEVYSKASQFASSSQTADAFNKSISKFKLNKRYANNIKEADYYVPGLESPREVVRWAYGAKEGDVSKIFDINGNKYVIAKLVKINEKGIPELADIKSEIEPLVIREKKAEKLISDLKSKMSGGDIVSLSQKLNQPIDTALGVSLASPNFGNVGNEPELVGNLVAFNGPKLIGPIKGKNGVYVVSINNVLKAPDNNTDMLKFQISNKFISKSSFEVFRILEENTDIVDNRGKFY